MYFYFIIHSHIYSSNFPLASLLHQDFWAFSLPRNAALVLLPGSGHRSDGIRSFWILLIQNKINSIRSVKLIAQSFHLQSPVFLPESGRPSCLLEYRSQQNKCFPVGDPRITPSRSFPLSLSLSAFHSHKSGGNFSSATGAFNLRTR